MATVKVDSSPTVKRIQDNIIKQKLRMNRVFKKKVLQQLLLGISVPTEFHSI